MNAKNTNMEGVPYLLAAGTESSIGMQTSRSTVRSSTDVDASDSGGFTNRGLILLVP